MIAKAGDKIKVDYVGKLDDGSVFDSSDSHKMLNLRQDCCLKLACQQVRKCLP
ncbi:MAG: FKBP-type peptidyl-prolyl cis-trans isomerase [Nitrosotalea sp.]